MTFHQTILVHNFDQTTYLENTEPMLSHINVGTSVEVTIKELSETVKDVVEFRGALVFDETKPDGTLRKLMDVQRLRSLGYSAPTNLRSGLEVTYADYLENAASLRM